MKHIILSSLLAFLFFSCEQEKLEFKYSIVCNEHLVNGTRELWVSKINDTLCVNEKIDLYESTIEKLLFSQWTSYPNPDKTFYGSLFNYNNGHGWSPNHNMFSGFSITDSTVFRKVVTFKKDNQTLMSTNLDFYLYNLNYRENNTWYLGLIRGEDFFLSETGFSHPILKYKYTINKESGQIESSVLSEIFYELEDVKGGKQTGSIRLKFDGITVENGKVKFNDSMKDGILEYNNEFFERNKIELNLE